MRNYLKTSFLALTAIGLLMMAVAPVLAATISFSDEVKDPLVNGGGAGETKMEDAFADTLRN